MIINRNTAILGSGKDDIGWREVHIMKIKKLETFLANAGQRNYLFGRPMTDTGLGGVGEAYANR